MRAPVGISRRGLLAASLALPAIARTTVAQAAVPAAQPIARLETGWWKARHEAKLAELRNARPELIWLGDSITENFEHDLPQPWGRFHEVWQKYYAPRHAVNLGFKGDATCHLLWRLQHGEIDGIAPKAAVILIGANNLGRLHWSAADTLLGIGAILSETQRRLPHTKILLLSVLPSDRTPWASQTTIEINRGLAERSRSGFGPAGAVTFQDVSSLYEHQGRLDHALFYDPLLTPPEPALHPTADGMARLAAAIEPNLAALMR